MSVSILVVQNLLLSFLKYGTCLHKWYNWYIVYTTLLDYNNHILFRHCQVLKLEGEQGIPDQIVPTSSLTALSHTANDTACLALLTQAACKEKEGKEDLCALRYVTLTS